MTGATGARPWLTLGELRRRTAHLPDETPITACSPVVMFDGSPVLMPDWFNLDLDDSGIPAQHPPHPDSDDENSILLGLVDNFDTRQW